MRIFKIFLGLLAVLLVVGAVFAWTLPADLAYRWGQRYLGPVTLSGISGTAWSGHADGVAVFGRDLGELTWRVSKSAVLRREVVADLRIAGAEVEAAGLATRRPDGLLDVHDVRFRFPAAMLAPALDVPSLQLLGTVSGTVGQATLADGFVRDANGNARWSEAGVAGQAEARFNDLVAEFASQADGAVAGTVHDEGQGNLAVTGTFAARPLGFDAQVKLSARGNDPQVSEALRYVGEPQADGSSLLLVHGNLFKLF